MSLSEMFCSLPTRFIVVIKPVILLLHLLNCVVDLLIVTSIGSTQARCDKSSIVIISKLLCDHEAASRVLIYSLQWRLDKMAFLLMTRGYEPEVILCLVDLWCVDRFGVGDFDHGCVVRVI